MDEVELRVIRDESDALDDFIWEHCPTSREEETNAFMESFIMAVARFNELNSNINKN